jgi:sec-independent protein translocase protein TatB
MFDIGWGELVVIGVVALIAIGPKELPGVLRTVGQMMGKVRRMASEFQGQFQEAMREAEMADVRKELDSITSSASDLTRFDPLADVQKDLDKVMTEQPAAAETPAQPGAPRGAVAEPNAAEPTALPPPPEVEIAVPTPEPPPPVTAEDFAPPEQPPKQAGGGA